MTDDRRTRDSHRCRRCRCPVHAMANGGLALMHARLGLKARWFCKGCTKRRYQGRFPCTECCGWTASADKVARGVLTVYGQLNARCVP